jgi:hypothetical protein
MPLQVYLSPVSPPAVQARASVPAANAADAQAGGALGPDDLGPPPAPGTEVRLTTDPTGVVAHCDATLQTMAKRGLKVIRKVVSQNFQYGVVWRADVAVAGDTSAPFRMTCWRIPGSAEFSLLLRPLRMFDPAASIPPLGP